MIPPKNKELFLERIALGDTFEEACITAQISVPSMYRFLKDPELRDRYDAIVFKLKKEAKEKADTDGMSALKAIIQNRKR